MSPKPTKLPGNAVDRLGATYRYLLGNRNTPGQQGVDSALNREVRDALISTEVRQGMAGILHHVSQQGMCTGGISEASLRIQGNQFLVTRKNSWFHDLVDEDLILVLSNAENSLDPKQFPAYWQWQAEIYRKNPGAKAIILGQPSAVMALAASSRLPSRDVLPAAADILGKFSLCQPVLSEIAYLSEHNNTLIFPGIGVMTTGGTLSEAAVNLELINKLGEITQFVRESEIKQIK